MRDWCLTNGQVSEIHDLVKPARGAANAKGSYSQITAATTFAYDGVRLQLSSDAASGGGQTYLIDLAIGAAASELVVIPNMLIDCARNANAAGAYLDVPISIASGSRLAARVQEAGGAGTRNGMVQVVGYAGSWNSSRPGAGIASTYGAVTASTNGTLVDQGGAANTWGSWTEITSASALDHGWIGGTVGLNKQTAAPAQALAEIEIGVGAAASEVTIGRIAMMVSSTDNGIRPNGFGMYRHIPAATRIAARSRSTSAGAADRHLTLVLYGV